MLPTLINNRYRVLRELGEGGMASVFLGEDILEGNRKLAIKVLLPEAARRDTIRHFQYEFSLLTRLRHPNLAAVYDFGNDPGTERFFFTCEFVEGQDFFEAAHGATLPEIADLAAQLCRALDYIHSKGLIHFDVKPSNVLVCPAAPGGRPVVKLLDFGLAGDEREVGDFRVRGTVHYMAPEIVRASRADRRADIYSLGVTLYQVLTGKLPFDGRTTQSVLRKHLVSPPPSPTFHRADLPPDLAQLVLRLLAKEPHERFSRPTEVIEALNRALSLTLEIETRATRESYILSGKLVGRQPQIDRIAATVEASLAPAPPANTPGCVLILGEAGLGCSRLLRETKYQVQLSGGAILVADATRNRTSPFGAFADLLRQLLGEVDPATTEDAALVEAMERYGAELVKVLPDLAARWSLAPSPALDSKEEALRLTDAISGFLLEAAVGRPMVLSLDNVEGADQGTLDTIRYLARNLALARQGRPVRAGTEPPGARASSTASTPETGRVQKGETVVLPAPSREASPAALGGIVWGVASGVGAAATSEASPTQGAAAPTTSAPAQREPSGVPQTAVLPRPSSDEDEQFDAPPPCAAPTPPRFLVLLGFRSGPGPVRKEADAWLTALRAMDTCETHELHRLADAEQRELLASMLGTADLPDALVQAAAEDGQGNPALIEAAVTAFVDQGVVFYRRNRWEVDPERLARRRPSAGALERIQARLAGLPPAALAACEVLAILDAPTDADLLAGVAGSVPSDLYPALATLRTMGLVVRDSLSDPATYALSDRATLEAVLAGLAPARRRSLSGRAALLLESRYAAEPAPHLDELARHFLASENPARGLRYILAAADRARKVYANELALTLYGGALAAISGSDPGQALDLKEKIAGIRQGMGDFAGASALHEEVLADPGAQADPRRRARVLVEAGRAAESKADLQRAVTTWREARRLAEEAGDLFLIAQATGLMAHTIAMTGKPAEAIQLCDELLPRVQGQDDAARILYGALGLSHLVSSSYPLALEWYAKRLEIDRRRGNPLEIAGASSNVGLVHLNSGDLPLAAERFAESLRLAESAQSIQAITYMNNLARCCRRMGEYKRAHDLHEKSLARTEKIGELSKLAFSTSGLALVLLEMGRFDDALRHYGESIRLFRKSGVNPMVAADCSNVGSAHLELANYVEAHRYLDEALSLSKNLKDKVAHASNLVTKGQALTAVGEWSQAADHIELGLALAREKGIKDLEALAHLAAAEMALATHRPTECRDALGRVEALLGSITYLYQAQDAHLRAGWVRARLGEFDAAEEHRRKGAAIVERCGLGSTRGLSLLTGAAVERTRGRRGFTDAFRSLNLLLQTCVKPEERWQAHALLATLHQDLGGIPEARHHCAEALKILEEVASLLPDAWRAGYLCVPDRQAVRTRSDALASYPTSARGAAVLSREKTDLLVTFAASGAGAGAGVGEPALADTAASRSPSATRLVGAPAAGAAPLEGEETAVVPAPPAPPPGSTETARVPAPIPTVTGPRSEVVFACDSTTARFPPGATVAATAPPGAGASAATVDTRLAANVQLAVDARDRLQEMVRSTHRLAREHNLEALLSAIMDAVIRLSGAQRGFLVLTLDGEPTTKVARGMNQADIHAPESQVSHSVLERAMRERRPVLSENALADERLATQRSVQALELRSVLCFPLEIRGAVCGAIYLDHRGVERAFTEDDLAWIEGFGDHVSIAIENAMLHARATQEPGTGLATRSHFLARLRAEVRQAKADGYPVALLLLDVDGVRLHNDLHGYAGGNQVLNHMSRILARTADEGEVAARIRVRHPEGPLAGRLGGDEFALLLPDVTADAALSIATQILSETSVNPPVFDREPCVYTASAGLAVYPVDAEDCDLLLLRADEALYNAKRAGRNRASSHSVGEGLCGDSSAGRGLASVDPELAKALPARDGMAVLGMLARILGTGMDLQRMLDLALGMLLDVTKAERGIILLKGSAEELRPISARRFTNEEIASPQFEVSSTLVSRVFRTGRAVRVSDPSGDSTLRTQRSIVELGIVSVLAVPIQSEGQVIGVIYLDTRTLEKELTAEDEALVAAFAERLAGPVQVSSRHAAAVKESETARRALADSLEACRTKYDYRQLVGQAPAMRAVFKLLDRATDTSYPVIVSGESGTGVELVARAIHFNGPRKERAFIS
ncbi:MAG: GAF domain-containing protein, partial [Planctomycetes bacterium]|nr:GAF domain-containing protein [Planctomycetota bacterium]